jgi:hypothetical protein
MSGSRARGLGVLLGLLITTGAWAGEIEIFKAKPVEPYRGRSLDAPSGSTAGRSSGNAQQSSVMQGGLQVAIDSCTSVRCEVQEGWQPGLTTVELSGTAPALAGRSLHFAMIVVGREDPIEDHKVGVLVNGHFTTSIAAYKLQAGQYAFGLFDMANRDRPLAYGTFSVRRANTGAERPAERRPSEPSRNAGVVGTWHGVGGTMGKIELLPNGTYTSNGEVAGRYEVRGNEVVFTGNLAAWNGGRATLKNDVMEFYWKNPSGATNYFAFGKY